MSTSDSCNKARDHASPYHTHKSKWTKSEDEELIKIIKEKGASNWGHIATFLPGRNGKQCRERWLTNLSPDVRMDPWEIAEDMQLINLHTIFGNKWSCIATKFNGRTPIAIKNRWNWLVKRGILKTNEDTPIIDDTFEVAVKDNYNAHLFADIDFNQIEKPCEDLGEFQSNEFLASFDNWII